MSFNNKKIQSRSMRWSEFVARIEGEEKYILEFDEKP
jgi:hypothetical protein